MFFVPLLYLDQTRLEKQMPEAAEIRIRGYEEKCRPEADLSGHTIGVHLLADYCPTDRYLYILKKIPNVILEKTWESSKGKIFEEIYFEVYNKAKEYLLNKTVGDLRFEEWINETANAVITRKKQEISQIRETLTKKPRTGEVREFHRQLEVLCRFELQMFSSYLSFLSCRRKNMNLDTTFQTVFNFVFEHPLDGTKLGLANDVRPDFIFIRKIIGDIKTGGWEEFYRVMIAAYAMAYEASENEDMDWGIVLNPTFLSSRSTPLYLHSDIFVVNDNLRKAFLMKRNQKLNILRGDTIPALPAENTRCKGCGYFSYCWEQNQP